MQNFIQQLRTPEPAPPWGLLNALGIVVGAFIMTALVGGVIASTFAAQGAAALLIGWSVGGALTVMLVLITRRDDDARAALRLAESSLPLLIAFGVGLGVAVTLDLIAIPILGEVRRPPELLALTAGAGVITWGFALVFMLAVQPLAEELVFRGVLFPALREAQSITVAVIVSAAFYGIFHQLVYTAPRDGFGGFWYGLAEPTLVGVVLGLVRGATGSTRAAVAVHVGVGAFALIKTLLIFST